MDFPGEVMLHFGANYGPRTLSGDWWRLLTYMFLHGGIMHIAFNMWCLWDLGALCESLYGRWTFAAIYLITGVSAGLASVAWNPGVLSVGASGAIFGLAGALIASFYLGEFSLPKIAIRGTLRSLLVFAVFNLVFGGLISRHRQCRTHWRPGQRIDPRRIGRAARADARSGAPGYGDRHRRAGAARGRP